MPKKGLLLIPVLIFFLAFFLFFRQTSEWDGTSRFRMALVSNSGSVSVLLLSPSKNEVQVAEINPDLEVAAAHGLGNWKVGSLWKLGEQEKISGNILVKETLIQSLGMPLVGVWSESGKLTDKFSLIKSFLFGKGDLSLKTRLRIVLFMLRAPVNVSDKQLTEITLGFFAVEPLNDVTDSVITVVNKSRDKSVYIDSLSRLISNMGGKILDVTNLPESDNKCEVIGESEFAKKLSLVLECDFKSGSDPQIIITNNFLKRF